MRDYQKEVLQTIIGEIERRAKLDAYELILTKLQTKRNIIYQIIYSQTALEIWCAAHGERFQKLNDKRKKGHAKLATLDRIIYEITEIMTTTK